MKGEDTGRRPGRGPAGVLAAAAAVVALIAIALVAGASGAGGSTQVAQAAPSTAPTLSSIHHVFIIVLENEDAANTFGPTNPAPYLSVTMRSQGTYLQNYYGIGHASLDNYIAMISGQPPNSSTQADCNIFVDFPADSMTPAGLENGSGCVYPADIPTVASQLDGAVPPDTWKAYEDSMGTPCQNSGVGNGEVYNGEPPNGAYATRHDPFMYFHSILDPALGVYCNNHVVGLAPNLVNDLGSVATTPNYTFITPDVCDDGHDADSTCESNYSRHGGFTGINNFLSTVVPEITGSPAYKQDGLLIVTFDESAGDDTACCGEVPGPTGAVPGGGGPGGGVVGAVLMSPFITPGSVSTVPYNHYSLLASVEDIFGVARLGDAVGATPFGSDIFVGNTTSTTTTTTSSSPTTTSSPTSSSTSSTPKSSSSSSTTTSTTTTTTSTSTTTTTTPAPPACTATTLPTKVKNHKLPAGLLLSGISVTGSGHAKHKLKLTAKHAAKLKIVFKPHAKGHSTTLSHSAVACKSYAFALPAGHGTITITASVGANKATVVKTV